MTATGKNVLRFSLKLVTNTIVSQNSSTSGDHQCLDFIPGAALLGVAASKLYSQLSPQASDLLFQSGRVRFTDALPECNGQAAWPMPLCWHHVKGDQVLEVQQQGYRLNSAATFDPSRYALSDGLQPKQMRSGYITSSGAVVNVEKNYELKTAINAETGGAATSQLFGYQSLKAGQGFHFSVIADEGVDQTLLQQVTDGLSGPARIGRSRSAQFGQVIIEPFKENQALKVQEPEDKTLLRLWLLSDLALVDLIGNSLLAPDAEALGLPQGAQWLAEQSFIRTRSYAAFNAKRRCYDLQRQVISRGSVLVFRLPAPLNDDQIVSLEWAGLYQESGLGRMSVNPRLLASDQPNFESSTAPALKATNVAPAAPDSALARFLSQKTEGVEQEKSAEKYAHILVAQLLAALKDAAAWAGLPEGTLPPEAPNRSQWGRIRELALSHEGEPSALRQQLFESEHAVLRAREGQSAWRLPTGAGETLSNRVSDALGEKLIPAKYLGRALALACTRLMSNSLATRAEAKEVIRES